MQISTKHYEKLENTRKIITHWKCFSQSTENLRSCVPCIFFFHKILIFNLYILELCKYKGKLNKFKVPVEGVITVKVNYKLI